MKEKRQFSGTTKSAKLTKLGYVAFVILVVPPRGGQRGSIPGRTNLQIVQDQG
ncbi:MAG: hypothetical protein PF795_14685 [Kiritimatiellae bacterium]|nr:hypothetical protein [Kiritimatiellia bacterium]